MNGRLKDTLKEFYGSQEPDRRTEFIRGLTNDPRWRKLHPVSSFFRLHPIAMPAGAFTAAAALCLCILFFALGGAKMPSPDVPPVVITEMTGTTTHTLSTARSNNTVTTAAEHPVDIPHPPVNTAPKSSTAKSPAMTAKNSNIIGGGTGHSPAGNTVSSAAASVTKASTTAAKTTTAPTATTVILNDTCSHDYGAADIWASGNMNDFDLFFSYTDRDILAELNAMNFYQLYYIDLAAMHAEMTCEGTIVDTEYTSCNGVPYTIVSVEVSRVINTYRDDVVNIGDVIRILEPGGYISVADYLAANPNDRRFDGMTAEQKASTMLYDPISNREIQKIGDRYLYFLSKKCMERYRRVIEYPVEDDMYVRSVINDICQLRIDGDRYVLVNDDIGISYDREDVDANIPEQAIFDDPDSGRRFIIENDGFFYEGSPVFYAYTSSGKMIYLGMYDEPTENYRFLFEPDGCTVEWTKTGVRLTYTDETHGGGKVTEVFEIS